MRFPIVSLKKFNNQANPQRRSLIRDAIRQYSAFSGVQKSLAASTAVKLLRSENAEGFSFVTPFASHDIPTISGEDLICTFYLKYTLKRLPYDPYISETVVDVSSRALLAKILKNKKDFKKYSSVYSAMTIHMFRNNKGLFKIYTSDDNHGTLCDITQVKIKKRLFLSNCDEVFVDVSGLSS
jgi:hypothetical protein